MAAIEEFPPQPAAQIPVSGKDKKEKEKGEIFIAEFLAKWESLFGGLKNVPAGKIEQFHRWVSSIDLVIDEMIQKGVKAEMRVDQDLDQMRPFLQQLYGILRTYKTQEGEEAQALLNGIKKMFDKATEKARVVEGQEERAEKLWKKIESAIREETGMGKEEKTGLEAVMEKVVERDLMPLVEQWVGDESLWTKGENDARASLKTEELQRRFSIKLYVDIRMKIHEFTAQESVAGVNFALQKALKEKLDKRYERGSRKQLRAYAVASQIMQEQKKPLY